MYPGEKARLVSPMERIDGFNNGKCLYFYYHAYGKDVGAMNVYLVKDSDYATNTSAQGTKLWSIDRDLGDQWYIASVPTESSFNYRIIFEGISIFFRFFWLRSSIG